MTVPELRQQLQQVTGIDYLPEEELCKDCGLPYDDHSKAGICPRDPNIYQDSR